MTRSNDEFQTVRSLVAEGRNDCEISRITGIPRETIRDWRLGLYAGTWRDWKTSRYECGAEHDFGDLPAGPYAYLLGIYLGDGCLSRHPRGVWRLRIVSDSRYLGIIDECCRAMEAVMPGQHAHVLPRQSRCVEISMYSKHWRCFIPQHGPGREHERPIRLESWQQQLIDRETERFLRGLIHSDGCRFVANDRGVPSVRYHFSNRSEDIKRIFCSALDRLDIKWTRPNDRGIAIYRKDAVAQLDQFIGPKQ